MNPNGDVEMRVSWLDAPADFRVKNKPIVTEYYMNMGHMD
jgi:hypothetical protein